MITILKNYPHPELKVLLIIFQTNLNLMIKKKTEFFTQLFSKILSQKSYKLDKKHIIKNLPGTDSIIREKLKLCKSEM